MKIILFSTFIFSLLSAQTGKIYHSKQERKTFYDKISQTYVDKNIQSIWKSDTKQIFDQWVHEKSEMELIKQFPTIIHELFHSQCDIIGNYQFHTYYSENNQTIKVPMNKTYRSTELNSVIKKSVQDSIFRFGIYIGGSNELGDGTTTNKVNTCVANQPSSIQIGIFGILDEFAAYYHSCITYFQLEPYYLKNNEEKLFNDNLFLKIVPYYEFRFFIANYLLYAKNKYPEMYQNLINNKNLKVVYSLYNHRFLEIMGKINEKNIGDKNDWGMQGLKFDGTESDMLRFFDLTGLGGPETHDVYRKEKKIVNGKEIEKLIIVDKENFALFKKEYDDFSAKVNSVLKKSEKMLFFVDADAQIKYIQSKMTKELNNELERFEIKGLNSSNYQTFLE